MDPPPRKEKSKVKEPVSRVEKAKQKSAQQELKQRQRAEVEAALRNNLQKLSFVYAVGRDVVEDVVHVLTDTLLIYALNRVMTELEQQQFDEFCKQMQPPGE